MHNTKTRIFKLHRLQKQPRTTIFFFIKKSFLDTKYMSIDKEDSKNVIRIAVSLFV